MDLQSLTDCLAVFIIIVFDSVESVLTSLYVKFSLRGLLDKSNLFANVTLIMSEARKKLQ